MDYITLATKRPSVTNEETFPLTSLYEALQDLADPRRAQGERYDLALILCLLVVATGPDFVGIFSTMGGSKPMRRRAKSFVDPRGESRS